MLYLAVSLGFAPSSEFQKKLKPLPQPLAVVLDFVEVFAGPVPDEHLKAVGGHVGCGMKEAVGHLFVVEEVEDGLCGCYETLAVLTVKVAQQPGHLLFRLGDAFLCRGGVGG